jgi:hypothetical protein
MTDLDQLLAERACARLIAGFVRHLDVGAPSDVATLFTEDGVWEWPGGDRRIAGRAALAEYFGSRPPDRLSRRLCTDVLVDVLGPDEARSTCSFVTFRIDGWTGALLPPPPATQVGGYADRFRRVGGEWLLARRTLTLTFGGPTPTAG